MERIKSIKECLIGQVQTQMGNLQEVNTKELGEVIDMIKDLEETLYYCHIVKAMEKAEEEEGKETIIYNISQYPDMNRMYYPNQPRNSDGTFSERPMSRGSNSGSGNYSSSSYSGNGSNSSSGRSGSEGRSGASRRTYMESKAMHQDKPTMMRELENYMNELTADITEMISDASPEERQMLQKKISVLADKIK